MEELHLFTMPVSLQDGYTNLESKLEVLSERIKYTLTDLLDGAKQLRGQVDAADIAVKQATHQAR